MTNTWFLYVFFSAALIGAGLYALLAKRNLIKLFIAIEVSLVATALAIIINIYRHTKSLDIRKLAKLKG